MARSMKRCVAAAAAFASLALVLTAAPAQAQKNEREYCAMILRIEGGKFTHQPDPSLSVVARTAGAGPLDRTDLPDNLTGFACFRRSQIPRVDDVEVLQGGLKLYVATPSPTRIMEIELVENKVAWHMNQGSLTDQETKETEAAVAAMQARLASPSS